MLKLMFKILCILSKREKEKKSRVIEYIDKCLEHLKVILFYEKHTEQEIEYSRKFLQGAYQNIYLALDGVASPREADQIKKSLMAGRVYYHAVKYGSVNDDTIKADYTDRLHAYVTNMYKQDEFRQNSNEVVLKELIVDGKTISREEREYKLSKIKSVCEEDIARIETLREVLKTRVVFYL